MDNKLILDKEKPFNPNLPVIKKQIFQRDAYSLGSLDSMIRQSKGQILQIWGNHLFWHVIIKY